MVVVRGSGGLDKPRAVDRFFRVTLPPEARELLGVEEGDFVKFEIDGKAVRIRKVKISVE